MSMNEESLRSLEERLAKAEARIAELESWRYRLHYPPGYMQPSLPMTPVNPWPWYPYVTCGAVTSTDNSSAPYNNGGPVFDRIVG